MVDSIRWDEKITLVCLGQHLMNNNFSREEKSIDYRQFTQHTVDSTGSIE